MNGSRSSSVHTYCMHKRCGVILASTCRKVKVLCLLALFTCLFLVKKKQLNPIQNLFIAVLFDHRFSTRSNSLSHSLKLQFYMLIAAPPLTHFPLFYSSRAGKYRLICRCSGTTTPTSSRIPSFYPPPSSSALLLLAGAAGGA